MRNSDRNSGPSSDAEAYWRRRFFILVGGLVVLVGAAWLLSGRGHTSSAGTPTTALRAGDTLPSAAYGSAWPGATPTLATSPAPSGTGLATPSQPGNSASAGDPTSPAASTSATAAGTGCAPGDIVLSLFTSQPSYAQSAQPQFEVYAVSTASGSCRMAYGAGSVRVVVTRQGQVVWDSQACGAPAAKTVQFQRGVPQVLTLTWNRASAGPSGCAGSLPKGSSGTFDAVALSAGRSSPLRTFTLLR